MIQLKQGEFGTYEIQNLDKPDQETILIQIDWDFPGTASTFGWSHEHGETDGTVDCPVCHKTAHDMISEARVYLDNHIGAIADDPGYFN